MNFVTSDLRRNIIKVVCLTIGLAVGFLLVAKVYFEQTYDTFFPDHDRLYILTESVEQSGEFKEYRQVAGAIAPGVKRYCPQVEAATRITWFLPESNIRLDDGRMFEAEGFTLADSSMFDVLPTKILAGDPRKVLETKSQVMIPRSLAEKIGGDVVGMEFCVPDLSEEYKATIGGVYEDYPLNSTIYNHIYVSLPTIGLFSFDGRDNWVGNDRYAGFVRLAPGVSPDDLEPGIRKMLADNVDRGTLEVLHFNIGMEPLVGQHTGEGSVGTMIRMLSLLAVIMLMSAGLNYLLIVIGQMGHRSREMAVRKCYGTSNLRIFGRVMGESLFFLLVSMALALLLIWCFSDQCRQLLGYTPAELFSTGKVWNVEAAVVLGLLIVTGAVPAWLYCRTPVAHAFRSNRRSRKGWKLALLFIQFFSSGLLMCMLVLVGRQYSMLSGYDMGFEYENIGYVLLNGLPQESRKPVVDELKRLGCVDGVASSYQNLVDHASGNNVWLDDDPLNTVNVADMYYANPDLFRVMGMRMLQGDTFSENADSTRHEVVVEKRFIKVLQDKFGVKGENMVGRTFHITEHAGLDGYDEFTICGVVDDMTRGGFFADETDRRAAVFFPTDEIQNNLYVRFNKLTPETLAQAQAAIDRVVKDRDIYISPYRLQVERLRAPVWNFGVLVMIIGIAILVIALIGLVGYTADEVMRRSREIAIRKVAGTPASSIVGMFCIDILKIALPSLVAGGVVSLIVGRRWLSQFSSQVSLSPAVTFVCVAALVLLVLSVTALNSLNVARSNPVEHLRSE